MRAALVALLLASGSMLAHAQDAATALARAERAYRALRTLRAEFQQTITNPMLGAPEESRGTLYLAPPDRFAMLFSEPVGDRIVVDGTWLWAYTPSSVPGQVIRQPVPTAGATTPNLFGQFVDRPLERYTASYGGAAQVAGDSVDLVTLVPKSADPPFRRATIATPAGSAAWRSPSSPASAAHWCSPPSRPTSRSRPRSCRFPFPAA
jgi:outer membrane lipoprotein carrier protein